MSSTKDREDLSAGTKAQLAVLDSSRQRQAMAHDAARRLRDADAALQACADYGRGDTRAAVYVEGERPFDLLALERSGHNEEWPAGNGRFCRAWIADRWGDAREKSMEVLSADDIASIRPPDSVSGSPAESAFLIARALFERFVRGEDAGTIVRELIQVRECLGGDRYALSVFFDVAAAHVGSAARGSRRRRTDRNPVFVTRQRVAGVRGLSSGALQKRIERNKETWPPTVHHQPLGAKRIRVGWWLDDIKGHAELTPEMVSRLRDDPGYAT